MSLIDVDMCLLGLKANIDECIRANALSEAQKWQDILSYLEDIPAAYDINKVINILEDYGKYRGVLAPTGDGEWDNFIPVSIAKKIVKGSYINDERCRGAK